MDGPSLDIEAWLAGLGLGGYAEAFRANDVDGDTLAKLTGEDLKEIGVASVGHRRKLLAAIAALGEGSLPGAAPSDEPSGERRQVTVLFADLSNFTGLSSELGAEATHALLNRYFETVDGIVEGYGGTIDKHMGDNVMAVFGAPLAHTDDPERAVRAALDIHAAMDDLSEDLGRPLAAHVGIASGQVVASGTGSAAHREYTVTGDTVNLASRLQDQAKAGETLISDSVRRSTAHRVASASCGRVSVKGFVEEVEVWVVRHLISEPIFDRGTPFLGRQLELSQFTALLDGVLKHNRGHTLLLRGEPGIGKTRLVEEFDRIAGAQGLSRHRSAILDFGVAKGQDALGVLVASLLSAGPDAANRREAAQRAIDETWVSPDNRPFLHAVLDLPPPPEARELFGAMDSETRKQGTIETIGELIAALSARGPLLLMVEDVHWADRSTLDLLAAIALAVADVPALLVMTSRVEGPALEQEWLAARRGCPSTT
ncbi:MAG: adenylate/guanylate cyclase domain-containing protein, partial [Kiloniellales bacterium]|nr:adenylate/guanylate cyclase domain-containing protein [Kiloniellales bacterium]